MITGDVTITSSNDAENVNTGNADFTFESECSTTGDPDFMYECSDNINTKETSLPADVDNGHHSSCGKRKTVSVLKRSAKNKNTTKHKKKNSRPKKRSIRTAKAKSKPSSSATASKERDDDPNWKDISGTFTSA